MTSLSIPKYVSIPAAVLLMLLAAPVAYAESAARYEAVFFDGARLDGDKMSGWGEHPGSPRLDNTALLDAKRPLRWLRDRKLRPWRPGEYCPGYIEFVGGDRLVGRIVGAGAGNGLYVPEHLVVKPVAPLHQPIKGSPQYVRILPGRIGRVVFGRASRRRLQPGTLYYRNGRQLGFVHLRWKEESVVLLLKDGTSEVKTSEIAEVHLPRIDPWQAYYRELAALSPACRLRLVRIETTGGLIATGSALRFGALAYGAFERRQAVAARLKQLGEQLASIAGKRKANQLKLDRARAKYHGQLAESEKQEKAARQAYQKAAGDMRSRIDGLRKADSAELAKRRDRLTRDLRAAEQEMQEWLDKAPVEKHDKIIETFDVRQAQLRKSREKSLEDERLKLEAREKQRQKELEQFISAGAQKLQRQAKELQDKAAEAKRLFEAETVRWKKFLAGLESARSHYAAVRGGTSETWSHIIQPVWSLDPLWTPFRSIRMRWSFAPEQVPLCRVPPASTVSPPFLPRFINRSSTGRPLRSGADEYAWGFAVHAYSELRFSLPKFATAFRGRIGLDNVVGSGGCARARVYVGSTRGKPAYESPLLIGSKKTVDTGRVELEFPPGGARLLVLQADPADRGVPSGADPLNIRDKLDWLDPRIELDISALQEQVRRWVGPALAASPGWAVRLDRRGVYTWTSRLDKTDKLGGRRFWTMLQAGAQPLNLRREMKIGPADKWLAVHLGSPGSDAPRADTVTLRVVGRRVKPRTVPIRQEWQEQPAPLAFALQEYKGKRVTLELTQPAGGKPLHWQAVRISPVFPPAYRLAKIMTDVGKKDMKVSYELGLALQSVRIPKGEKLAALEITERGGKVNFKTHANDEIDPDTLNNVMIGQDWKGGDKAFLKISAILKKMNSLKRLLVTGRSGVSAEAVAKFRAAMPELEVAHVAERIPSVAHHFGDCTVTWRNHTGKLVLVLYILPTRKLQGSRWLEPGQVLVREARVGYSYEAHYGDRKAPWNAYTHSVPLSSFIVKPNAVWDIRPR